MSIYLVRHGQTEFNAAQRWQGQVDSPLTELGRQQAARMGRRLAGLTGTDEAHIFSSPLGRARQTCEIIASEIGMIDGITLDPGLMEIGMGAWDGMTDYEIDHEYPGLRDGLDRHEWFFHAPGGETFEKMADRVSRSLETIKQRQARDAIIICHGITSRILRGVYASLPKDETLRLEVPQDAFFHLRDGDIARIDC
ncbi:MULTISPECIES: histidine phosphatase family protein [Rhizobium/Agrobacterium group]|uniref:Histidine phosphatase family protein n=2 Tax=Rhizobium/Agrobacterium group TaxID=227290 RepID=A0AA88EVW2_RHIRH|nr:MULTISPECIES: histidine phosphatase family protein [Rhizobium/Agrobacterium group]KAA3497845.1 histidine phosphatase family protein [Rhizobium rhizogenes]MBO0131094.1 histidine phosphatase family protein [Agrobacterium burrii]NTZ90855.1 histidine phosphatase family protein [Agrobacterium tumefaciens]